jgi:hypothetical protein
MRDNSSIPRNAIAAISRYHAEGFVAFHPGAPATRFREYALLKSGEYLVVVPAGRRVSELDRLRRSPRDISARGVGKALTRGSASRPLSNGRGGYICRPGRSRCAGSSECRSRDREDRERAGADCLVRSSC